MKRDVELFLFDVNYLKDKSLYNKSYEIASNERKLKISRIKNESDRLRSLGVELVLLYAKNHTGFTHYNLSHSGDFSLCGVCDTNIGVDIEQIRDIDLRIAKRFFTEIETQYVNDDINHFFTIWTLKESYLKCIKKGLGLSLSSFEIDIENKKTSNGYYLESIDLNGYKIGICTDDGPINVILNHIEEKEMIKWLEMC